MEAAIIRRYLCTLLLTLCWFGHVVDSHIVLTYPPARKYPIDGLLPATSRRPCGVPKGLGPVTEFRTGEAVKVTFHISYPHQGGISLRLLNNRYEVVQDYTNGIVFDNDPVRTYYDITLPSTACPGCTLQALRETRESPDTCGSYRMSCADINIVAVSASSDENRCMGHGTYSSNDGCVCDTLYSGDRCQYKDNCEENEHCNNHGECVDIGSSNYPRKQCFCDAGWFGRMCEKESTISRWPTDMSSYTHVTLSSTFEMYYRFLWLHKDVEVILKAKTISWVALGWRPKDFKSGCKLFPTLDWTAEATYQPADSTSGRLGDESIASTCGGGPAGTGTSDTTGDAALHEMDCTDIVVGTARGNRSCVGDFYSRDKSSPLMDERFGGTQSLSGALGKETDDGFTTILFRKKMHATERTDHSLAEQELYLIWAYGQSTGNYVHPPDSGMTAPNANPSDPNFVKTDQFTYHGYSDHRGNSYINFTASWTPETKEKVKVPKGAKGLSSTEWIIIGVLIAALIGFAIYAIVDFCTRKKN